MRYRLLHALFFTVYNCFYVHLLILNTLIFIGEESNYCCN